MGIIIRGMRNVLRSPLRLILVVLLLGVSLMFVAAMVSLNNSAQQQLATVHKEVGTSITITYASNDAGQFGNGGAFSNVNVTPTAGTSSNGNSRSGGFGAPGSSGSSSKSSSSSGRSNPFTGFSSTPIPNSVTTTVSKVAGVSGVEEALSRSDTDDVLKTSTIEGPNGNSITIPPTVYGYSQGATHFTVGNGATPTLVSGHNIESNEASSDVALLSQALATKNSLKVGSTFKLKGKTFTVIGIYTTTSSNQFASDTMVIPLTTMQSIFSVKGVDSITAYATTYDQVSTVTTKLQNTLGKKYDVTAGNSAYTSAFSALSVAQNSISLTLYTSIIAAAVIIIFAVFITVRERAVEIGTLKAIGASHWQVIRQFWGEVLAMSGLSAILAVILLAAFGPYVSQKFNVTSTTSSASTSTSGPGGGGFGGRTGGFFNRATLSQIGNIKLASATLNLQTVLIIVGLGIALAIVASVIPSLYVARTRPAVVLRRGN